ncbi:cytochrome P450 [Nemania sp. NC0429]|nr:cytochrome P450 [Nemania sp. NC0429]
MASSAVFGVIEKLCWSQAAYAAAGMAILGYILSCVVAWHKLRHIPGPFTTSFSYMWTAWAAYSGRVHLIMDAQQKKYGDILRVGPDGVMVSDAESIYRIQSARSPYTRGGWYSGSRLDYRGDSVFTELDDTRHSKRKAILSTAFSGNNVKLVEAKVDKWIAALVASIRAKVSKGDTTMEIGRLISYFQIDLITDLQIGKEWGDLAAETDKFGFVRVGEILVPAITAFSFIPAARALYTSTWFMKFLGPKPTDTHGVGAFLGIIEKEVKQRYSSNTADKPYESRDFLDEWIKRGLSVDNCQFDLSLVLPAGAETTKSVILCILLLLMSAPAVYQALKQEIRNGIAAGSISNPVTNQEAKDLKYLQAVIREGMRLGSPVSFGFPKRVPAPGTTVCGQFLPEGTNVFVNYHSILHNEETFGKDADIFRPERFLGDNENVRRMNRTVEVIFGGGRYVCLGKSMALIELNKVFIELLRVFDFQVGKPGKPWEMERFPTEWIVRDLWARVTEDMRMSAMA